MANLKEQLNHLPENERLELAQELILSLSESSINQFFVDFFTHAFQGRMRETFQQWLKTTKITEREKESEESSISGEEMKAWIRQQIAESESQYAEKMKRGEVKTYTLAELKAEFNE